MAERTTFGWRRVARILAYERDTDLLDAMGIPKPTGATRPWARKLLDEAEDFWEVYDVEPDGGEATRRLEAELSPIAGEAAMSGLIDACEVFSRPLDDRESLDHWTMLVDEIWRELELLVAPAGGLPARVRAVLAEVGWPHSPQIRLRPPEDINDDWEFGFWRETQVDAEQLADEVIETRHTERVLARLAEALTPEERANLVAWANAEDNARQGEPRPAIWPPKQPLEGPGVTNRA
ncbi:MAG TPA: hypothetical protein VGQ58_10345 [Candidatus Limnocylindrales bacterium]|jgi:hypothetical protein|nr:hypothetical protein [Candidatus Limnocylindrales bacterium]